MHQESCPTEHSNLTMREMSGRWTKPALRNSRSSSACPGKKTQQLPAGSPDETQHTFERQRLSLSGRSKSPPWPTQVFASPRCQTMAASRIP